MNMDYSLTQALHTCAKCKRVCHYYDVNCNFWLHFLKRCADSDFLSVPENMEFFRGIGLFHVHGHQNECFPRFAPSFITGAGQLDGEIIETLWVQLNEISGSTRHMSRAHRQETLDTHMNDSNWKKLTKMGISTFTESILFYSNCWQCDDLSRCSNILRCSFHNTTKMEKCSPFSSRQQEGI